MPDFHKLPIGQVVDHLIEPDGNDWEGRRQYLQADTHRRETIRRAVAGKITSLLVDGVNGDCIKGAIQAEIISNMMVHLVAETAQDDEQNASRARRQLDKRDTY